MVLLESEPAGTRGSCLPLPGCVRGDTPNRGAPMVSLESSELLSSGMAQ